ncbi:hypothetical protein DFR18_001876 [Salmonella bongori]|nr:hypothetical protein [Salmonella bongori]TNB50904.1 hypothetical protein FGW25_16510 [Salmonella bongori serovar 48:z35:-]ECE6546339.1 hypothetical protein [Salmonella bongori]ECI3518132.1 hypothetical protein [Salmonella bongori]EDP8591597.1 hypothetical protein [Salmonella bongori]
MVYRVYSSWIKEFNGDQVSMLNDKYSIVPIAPLKAVNNEKQTLKFKLLCKPLYTIEGYTIMFFN